MCKLFYYCTLSCVGYVLWQFLTLKIKLATSPNWSSQVRVVKIKCRTENYFKDYSAHFLSNFQESIFRDRLAKLNNCLIKTLFSFFFDSFFTLEKNMTMLVAQLFYQNNVGQVNFSGFSVLSRL